MSRLIPVAMSEADLVETLEDLGLPQFGSGFVADPAKALRRKNVAVEIEENIFPSLSRVISDAEIEELSEIDRKWFEEDWEQHTSAFEIYLLDEFGLSKN